jgi:hypothetical protein
MKSGQPEPAGAAPAGTAVLTVPRFGGVGPVTIRSRIPSPALQGLLAFVLYLAVWLAGRALPLVLHATRPMLNQTSQDPNFYVWSLRWWPYAIAHGLNPLYSHQIGAPGGFNLAWATTIGSVAVLAIPLTATVGPLVTFNLLVVLAPPLSAWIAFVLCRRLTRQFWPSLVGGAVFGFSAYEMNHIAAGQFNLTFGMLLPLMAYLVVVWREGQLGSRALLVLLAVAMTLQVYLFLETFAEMVVVWVVALLLGYVLAGRPGRAEMTRLSKIVGIALVIALVLGAPYFAYALAHTPPLFQRKPSLNSLNLESMFVPRPGSIAGLHWLAHLSRLASKSSEAGYVGLPLLAVTVALAVRNWSSKTTRFLLIMVAFLVLAALGPWFEVAGRGVFEFPWGKLWELPVVRSAFPERIMVFVYLGLAVVVAVWLARPGRAWIKWLMALLVLAALVQDAPAMTLPARYHVPSFIAAGTYRKYLTPGETVLVLSRRGNAGMLWQAETDFYLRLSGGYVNESITPKSDVPTVVADLTHFTHARGRHFRWFLKHDKIGAILVERHWAEDWNALLARLRLHHKLIGGVYLYQIGPHALTRHHVRARVVVSASRSSSGERRPAD